MVLNLGIIGNINNHSNILNMYKSYMYLRKTHLKIVK